MPVVGKRLIYAVSPISEPIVNGVALSSLSKRIYAFIFQIKQFLMGGFNKSKKSVETPVSLMKRLEAVQTDINKALENGSMKTLASAMEVLNEIEAIALKHEDRDATARVTDTIFVLRKKPEVYQQRINSEHLRESQKAQEKIREAGVPMRTELLDSRTEKPQISEELNTRIENWHESFRKKTRFIDATKSMEKAASKLLRGQSFRQAKAALEEQKALLVKGQSKRAAPGNNFAAAKNALQSNFGRILEKKSQKLRFLNAKKVLEAAGPGVFAKREEVRKASENKVARFNKAKAHLEKRANRLLSEHKKRISSTVSQERAKAKELKAALRPAIVAQAYKSIQKVQSDYRSAKKNLRDLERISYIRRARAELVKIEVEYLKGQQPSEKAKSALKGQVPDSSSERNANFKGVIDTLVHKQNAMLKSILKNLHASSLPLDRQKKVYAEHIDQAIEDKKALIDFAKKLSVQEFVDAKTGQRERFSLTELKKILERLDKQAESAIGEYSFALGLVNLKGRIIGKAPKRKAISDSLVADRALNLLRIELGSLKAVDRSLARKLRDTPLMEIKIPPLKIS